jgi:hypothetical protein
MTHEQGGMIIYLLIFLIVVEILILFRVTQLYWSVRPELWRPRRIGDLSDKSETGD